MGSFSWLKADGLTQVANIVGEKPFKFLIPKEFGGGFIKDYYQDYGDLGTNDEGNPKYDMYELLAMWNAEEFGLDVGYDGEFNAMKPQDRHTNHNRRIGIKIGCYNHEVDKLKYPLKLVSASFKGCYEDLDKPSYTDPAQGFYPVYREGVK